MRVKISANPPLPAVRAWFPLHGHAAASTSTISSFKSLLCTTLPAFCGVSPSSLHLSIDGFELLDHSELTIVRDGDLISIDVRDVPPENVIARDHLEQAVVPPQNTLRATQTRLEPAAPQKRKRRASTPSSPSSGSESDTEESSTSSDSGSGSDSDESSRIGAVAPVHVKKRAKVTASVRPASRAEHPPTFVPPGYGKPQTRARNLRRQRKRMFEREAANGSGGGPVSGANAVVPGKDAPEQVSNASWEAHAAPTLMSLSLRNKNKAKNFKSLTNRPLPAKIIFGDSTTTGSVTGQMQGLPRLIPPSSRSSLPGNLFVTSVDVEGEKERETKYYGDEREGLDYGAEPEPGTEVVDIDRLELEANRDWTTLEEPTREKRPAEGTLVGYKALGIDAVTCTPGEVLTVGRVVSCDEERVTLRPLRAASFSWTETAEAETEHPWEEIESGDWKVL